MSDLAGEKKRIRGEMRALRRGLGDAVQRQHAARLRRNIQFRSWFLASNRLGMYRAADGEISLQPLITLCWQLQKEVYLPCIAGNRRLVFREYRQGDRLTRSRLGIEEPLPRAEAVELAGLDILLLPLVAFTVKGDRLGMGGGFYDRALQNHRPGNAPGRKPRVVGVAHSCQRVRTLPREPWDVSLSELVTECGAVNCAAHTD